MTTAPPRLRMAIEPIYVREALQRLTAARVLTVISGRSIGIPPLSKERMLDLRRVRLDVEALAAEWATARMDAADIRKLEQLLRKAERAADEGDRAYIGLNRAIHFTIYRASGSDVLVAIIENFWLQVSPYFHFLYSSGNPHQAKKTRRAPNDELVASPSASTLGPHLIVELVCH